jgi:hypothetical protein
VGERHVLIECGLHSLDPLEPDASSLVDRVAKVKRRARQEAGVDLEIVPYAGSSGAHVGGRHVKEDNATLPEIVAELSSNGIAFVFVMNGGLLFADDVLPDPSEEKVLEAMARAGGSSGVPNKVGITRSALLPYLRRTYPGLDVIASCIQQTSPKEAAPYAVKLAAYDYVVALNQHTTVAYLSGLGVDLSRLIVFLKLQCGSPDTRCCYGDYLAHENLPPETILTELNCPSFAGLVGNRLPPESSGCNEHRATLLARRHDLEGLIRLGVDKFKVTRAQALQSGELGLLVELVRELQPS